MSRPRVPGLIDDGEWAGVPIGGLGSGSIGRSFRGDVSRWHLEVGRHAFRPVAADGFSVFVGGPDGSEAHVLSTLRPGGELPAWGFDLPVGAGTYHALFPRAWQAFEPAALGGVRLTGEQLSPVIAHDYERSALPVGSYEWRVENASDAPRTVGLMLSWANPLGARPTESPVAGPRQEAVRDAQGVAIVYRDGGTGPAGLRGTFAIAAAADDGVVLGARARFDARFDRDLWADFAADGRLTGGDDAVDRRPALAGESIGGAVSPTVTLEPGETRTIRFAVAWDLPVTEFGGGRRWWKRHTRTWGRTGGRALDLARHALAETPAWRAAIEAWQRPVIEDESLPAWYRAALFNELYFLVDGGTFWEARRGRRRREPEPDDPGRFALLECLDYPFYDTVDVDFYASAAMVELFPDLERRGIRDLLATVAGRGHDARDDRGVRPAGAAQGGVRRAARRRRPGRGPVRAANRYRFQDVNGWIDLAPKFALQVWRDVVLLDDDALVAEARPVVEAALRRLAIQDTRRRRAARPRRPPRPDV